MENGNTGLALGFIGGIRDAQEREEMMRKFEKRKANAGRIEAAMMAACTELADRLEKGAKDMSDTELAHTVTALAGIATTMGAMKLYASN